MSEPAGYSGTTLVRKLGIKPDQQVRLVDAPTGFALAELPAGVQVSAGRTGGPRPDVTLLFCPDRAALERWFAPLMADLDGAGCLWVAWPKKSSKVPTDLDENVVRAHGLAAGLVDVKVCAIDTTWSGLKFVYRLSDRAKVSSTQA